MSEPSQPETNLKLLGAGDAFRQELLVMMAGVDMLAHLHGHELTVLADYLQAFKADAGCVIFKEGEAGDFMCFLVSGRIRTYKESDQERSAEVSIETHGRSIGEMALIDGEPRSATCIAAAPTVLLLLTKKGFMKLADKHAALALKLLVRITRLMSRRLRMTSGRLVDYLDG
jgi:CRP/FNR family transcriptional regulator, cyclic AMP receptor protein